MTIWPDKHITGPGGASVNLPDNASQRSTVLGGERPEQAGDSAPEEALKLCDFYLIDANHSGPFEEPAPEGTVEIAVHELRQIRAALAQQ